MVPVIAGSGRSFQGAFLYYCHDKNALTNARVAWTETVNLLTDCADKAWKVMAYTAKHQDRLKEFSGQNMTGAKLQKPVFAYSLSWHPKQKPDKQTMLEAAHQSLSKLGLTEHEAMIAAHKDEPQPHIHIIVNKVHPLTGLVAKLKYSKRRLSDFALEWEKREGKIYCQQRTENKQKREQGQHTKYGDPHIIKAWEQSTNGQSFAAALEAHGYYLAQGRKRLVVVDPYGKTHNPVRHLPGIKARDFNARIKDIDTSHLPDATDLARDIQNGNAKQYQRNIRTEKRIQGALMDLEHRYRDERRELAAKHDRRIYREKQELLDYYDLKAKRRTIKALQGKVKNPSFWHKITGRAKREREDLRALILNYKNTKMRFDERMNSLTIKRDQALEALDRDCQHKVREVEHRLEQRKPKQNLMLHHNRQAQPKRQHHHSPPTLGLER